MRHFYDEWRAGNIENAMQYIDRGVVLHAPIEPPTYDAFQQGELGFASAAHDARYSIEDLAADDDNVAVRWRLDATDGDGS